MDRKPRLLDLFCGAGGAAMGYHRAGFEVVGVDINPQPHYPFEFHQSDALKYLLEHWRGFDTFHASPPCQAFTNAQRIMANDHPDFITATREAFRLIAMVRFHQNGHGFLPAPWVIENVPGSPLRRPLTLCGSDFGLRTYRHRLFESDTVIFRPGEHRPHDVPVTKMGRTPKAGEFMHVVGHFSGVAKAREAMGIDWMTRDELAESIPPAYTEFIGRQLIEALA